MSKETLIEKLRGYKSTPRHCEELCYEAAVEIESLRQQISDHIKREVMLRDALETCEVGDFSTGHVIYPSFDEKLVNEALAATAELDGLILCEKKPFEFRWELRSNGFVQHTEKLLHTISKDLWDITPLYRAWEQK